MSHQGESIEGAIIREFRDGASPAQLRERWGYLRPEVIEDIIDYCLDHERTEETL